jgi:hypothetical protein
MASEAFMNSLCRGLVAYVSYLATCRQSPVYSEAVLYEPIARMSRAQGWTVRAEVPVNKGRKGPGDFERLDFALKRDGVRVGLELKWANRPTCHVDKDLRKLRAFEANERFIIVFCPGKLAEDLRVIADGSVLQQGGKTISWNAGKTHYAAKWFRVTEPSV